MPRYQDFRSRYNTAFSRGQSPYFRMKKRTRTGKYGQVQNIQRLVTTALNKKSETKFYDIMMENRQLYHNLGGTGAAIPLSVTSLTPWFNPWANISEGSRRYERIGNKITPTGMSINLYLANKVDRPHTQIRVIVAILPKLVGTTITTQQFDPFQIANGGSNGNNMILPVDADEGVKFLYDKIHVLDNMGSFASAPGGGYAKECTKYIKLWIKRKNARPIVYNDEDHTIINKPLAVYCIPYEQYSTLTTDNVSSCAGYMRMYYKDV